MQQLTEVINIVIANLATIEAALVIVLGFVFFFFNELEDEAMNSTFTKNKSFLNKDESWFNKWKINDGTLLWYQKKWYHFGIYPAFEERFPYSSTLFVFLTDGEHLFQFIKIKAVLAITLVIGGWWMVLAVWLGIRLAAVVKERISWMR